MEVKQSKLRICKFTTTFSRYLAYFYSHNPVPPNAAYAELLAQFENDYYAENGLWRKYMDLHPEIIFDEFYIDNPHLQHQWAKEHQVHIGEHWQRAIVEAQIALFEPEVIYEDDQVVFNPAFRAEMKSKYPFIKTIVAWDGFTGSSMDSFEHCDIILTCVQSILEKHAALKRNVILIPFGFDVQKIESRHQSQRTNQILFIGNLYPFHQKRLEILYALAKRYDVSFYIGNFDRSISWIKIVNLLRQFPLRNIPKALYLYKNNKGAIYGKAMLDLYFRSTIALNVHGDQNQEVGNMRLIEAAGCGACVVTDYFPNVQDYFEQDSEIVCFRNKEEALKKVDHLIKNKDNAESIGSKAQQKVIQRYSFAHRVDFFLRVINSLIPQTHQ